KAIRTPVSSFLTLIFIVLLVGVIQGTARDVGGGTHDSQNLGTTPRLPALPLMPLLTRHEKSWSQKSLPSRNMIPHPKGCVAVSTSDNVGAVTDPLLAALAAPVKNRTWCSLS
ncbi:unnamed protein product, partial [Ectocarpus sp. 12 AP-2014]